MSLIEWEITNRWSISSEREYFSWYFNKDKPIKWPSNTELTNGWPLKMSQWIQWWHKKSVTRFAWEALSVATHWLHWKSSSGLLAMNCERWHHQFRTFGWLIFRIQKSTCIHMTHFDLLLFTSLWMLSKWRRNYTYVMISLQSWWNEFKIFLEWGSN